jgi:hypothetical protein
MRLADGDSVSSIGLIPEQQEELEAEIAEGAEGEE